MLYNFYQIQYSVIKDLSTRYMCKQHFFRASTIRRQPQFSLYSWIEVGVERSRSPPGRETSLKPLIVGPLKVAWPPATNTVSVEEPTIGCHDDQALIMKDEFAGTCLLSSSLDSSDFCNGTSTSSKDNLHSNIICVVKYLNTHFIKLKKKKSALNVWSL